MNCFVFTCDSFLLSLFLTVNDTGLVDIHLNYLNLTYLFDADPTTMEDSSAPNAETGMMAVAALNHLVPKRIRVGGKVEPPSHRAGMTVEASVQTVVAIAEEEVIMIVEAVEVDIMIAVEAVEVDITIVVEAIEAGIMTAEAGTTIEEAAVVDTIAMTVEEVVVAAAADGEIGMIEAQPLRRPALLLARGLAFTSKRERLLWKKWQWPSQRPQLKHRLP